MVVIVHCSKSIKGVSFHPPWWFESCEQTNNIGGFVSPPDIVRQCDRDWSGILSDDVRKRKDIAESPAVAQIIIINVRKHLKHLMPMPMRGLLRFIPFPKRRLLLYRYTSIDKVLTFNTLAICLPYGAIVYVNEPLNTLIINDLKKNAKNTWHV